MRALTHRISIDDLFLHQGHHCKASKSIPLRNMQRNDTARMWCQENSFCLCTFHCSITAWTYTGAAECG